MYETEQKKERVILVGISLSDAEDVDQSLDELEELARTAGAECVGRVIQKRELIHPGTYVGKGKLDEIRDLLWETEADGIICDDELSPAQIGNLKDELHTKVRSRWSLPSYSIASRDLPDMVHHFQGLEEVSVPEVPAKRSWRWTGD